MLSRLRERVMGFKDANNVTINVLTETEKALFQIIIETKGLSNNLENKLILIYSNVMLSYTENLQQELQIIKKFINALDLVNRDTSVEKDMIAKLESLFEKNTYVYKKIHSQIRSNGLLANTIVTADELPSPEEKIKILELLPQLRERVSTRTLDFLHDISMTISPTKFKPLYDALVGEL